jgi:hypothetical protein
MPFPFFLTDINIHSDTQAEPRKLSSLTLLTLVNQRNFKLFCKDLPSDPDYSILVLRMRTCYELWLLGKRGYGGGC